jgi:hypothetical protein
MHIYRSVSLGGTLVFCEIDVTITLFQPGEDDFPTDENGKSMLDTVDICATWEVSEYLVKG